MKYLMLIYGNEAIWGSLDADGFAKVVSEVDAFNQALRDSGELVAVDGLVTRPLNVRTVDGTNVVSDGPYLEAKEHVGSYFVVDVESEERAREIAGGYPGMMTGGLEVWPIMARGGPDV
jgi:hypothetical protein